MMRVLVCGGRNYSNFEEMASFLSGLFFEYKDPQWELIHGGAAGADSLAGAWATSVGIPVKEFRADWKKYGKSAGPRRNEKMLSEGKPDLVIAFPGGKGTADMVARARKAKVMVIEYNRR
jgi:hypothetical protein